MLTDTTPSSVKLTSDLRDRIKSLAHARNQSVHAIMVQAINSYVEREERREALRQEAKLAHEDFVMTGLHLTNAEVIGWMDEIIAGKSPSMPKCHI
ncbi:MAG: ribbon-helix-helix protein, CopG family [Deferribacteraceae bacterium]|jgi:predicted transcriptional regulator|nr:ribbon-helix-helix protein, CopG family [Deferribacteraceae bacterium]